MTIKVSHLTSPAGAEKKKIEFVKFLMYDGSWEKNGTYPHEYKNIELIQLGSPFDIMFAYDSNREDGCLYLGHFNDGVV